jgi:hypothetical protein
MINHIQFVHIFIIVFVIVIFNETLIIPQMIAQLIKIILLSIQLIVFFRHITVVLKIHSDDLSVRKLYELVHVTYYSENIVAFKLLQSSTKSYCKKLNLVHNRVLWLTQSFDDSIQTVKYVSVSATVVIDTSLFFFTKK